MQTTPHSEAAFLPLPNPAFLPKSIQTRGLSVPFSAEALQGTMLVFNQNSRAREAAVPSLSGKTGKYILRWDALPEVFAMPEYDKHLWHSVQQDPRPCILSIKKASRQLIIDGYAGLDAAANENARRQEVRAKNAAICERIAQNIAHLTREKEIIFQQKGICIGRYAQQSAEADITKEKLKIFITDMAHHALEMCVYGISTTESVSEIARNIHDMPRNIARIRQAIKTDEYDIFFTKISLEAQVTGYYANKNLEEARNLFSDTLNLMRDYFLHRGRLEEIIQLPYYSVDGWVDAVLKIAEMDELAAKRDLGKIEKYLNLIVRALPLLPPFVYQQYRQQKEALVKSQPLPGKEIERVMIPKFL